MCKIFELLGTEVMGFRGLPPILSVVTTRVYSYFQGDLNFPPKWCGIMGITFS